MTYWLQHGFGKAQKISTVAADGNMMGAILSAADEDPQSLFQTAQAIRDLGLQVLVDTQAYLYSSTPQGVARFHQPNGVSFPALHWSQDATATQTQLAAVELLNRLLTLTAVGSLHRCCKARLPTCGHHLRCSSLVQQATRGVAIEPSRPSSSTKPPSLVGTPSTAGLTSRNADVNGFYILVN